MFPPDDAADPSRIPGVLIIIGPDGPLGHVTRLSIEETDGPDGEPQRIVVGARNRQVDLELEVDAESATLTWMNRQGFGSGLDFYQLRATYRVSGRVGDRAIDFTAAGAAETFRGR